MTTETKMKTLLVGILDESGSMGPRRNDVIGGFNTFLEEQRKLQADDLSMVLAKFNTMVTVVHKAAPIGDVQPLTPETYTPGGMTALFDAIAQAIRLADGETFDRAVCLIMTDGEENSSRETTGQQVAEIIKAHEAKGNWTFAYIGENPERWARETGTSVRNTAQYQHGDPRASFAAASEGIYIARRSAEPRFDHVLDPDAAKKDDA
jgi:Mg-chelatase subunit ChlD